MSLSYYLDRVGRPKTLDTHQFIPKGADLSEWTMVDRPLSRAELLAQLADAETAPPVTRSMPASEPRVIDFGEGPPPGGSTTPPQLGPGIIDAEVIEEDDDDDDDDDDEAETAPPSEPATAAPPPPAAPPSGAPPGNGAGTPPGAAQGAAPPRVVDFTDGSQPPPGEPMPQHPQGGPVNRCGDANCTNCIYLRDRCRISGKPIRPPPPMAAVRTDVATFFGTCAGGLSLALAQFFDVPLVEAWNALGPTAEEVERVAVHAQIVEHRYAGGAMAEHAELRAMVGEASTYFARLALAAKGLVQKHADAPPATTAAEETPEPNGHDRSADGNGHDVVDDEPASAPA